MDEGTLSVIDRLDLLDVDASYVQRQCLEGISKESPDAAFDEKKSSDSGSMPVHDVNSQNSSTSPILSPLLSVPLSPPRPLKSPRASPPGSSPSHGGAGLGGHPVVDSEASITKGGESLLDSILPAAGFMGDPLRMSASLSALSVAYRQLELASSHLHTELGEARKIATAAESAAEVAMREASEAGEEAGFLRHCLERLQEERGVSNPLSLTSLPLLRGEALHAAMERINEYEQEARANREAVSAAMRERDALAWTGCGLAALRGELDRLVRSSATEGLAASSRVTSAQIERDEALKKAEEAERRYLNAQESLATMASELSCEREKSEAMEGLLESSKAGAALMKQRLEWAEEAVGVLKTELARRESIISAQGEALGKAFQEIEVGERDSFGTLEFGSLGRRSGLSTRRDLHSSAQKFEFKLQEEEGKVQLEGGDGVERKGGARKEEEEEDQGENGDSLDANNTKAMLESLRVENSALLAQIATLQHALLASSTQSEEDATEKALLRAQLCAQVAATERLKTTFSSAPQVAGGPTVMSKGPEEPPAELDPPLSIESDGMQRSPTPPPSILSHTSPQIPGAPRKPVRVNINLLDMPTVPSYDATE